MKESLWLLRVHVANPSTNGEEGLTMMANGG